MRERVRGRERQCEKSERLYCTNSLSNLIFCSYTASLYVQWAISVTGGIGYGFMGLGSTSSLQQVSERERVCVCAYVYVWNTI